MKQKILAANWKMNKLQADAKIFFGSLIPLVSGSNNKIIVCVPFTDLAAVSRCAKGSNICVGAQNVHWEASGAFTGEISADMLKDSGAEYVIVGHSERRQYFGETSQTAARRAKAAVAEGIIPIVCIGETSGEREKGQTEQILSEQIEKSFEGISQEEMKNVLVAYEPVWAIGTGVTATSGEAQEAISYIRKTFSRRYGGDTAAGINILYGGSMNEKNAADLLSMPDIDGGLIGGASLIAEKFAAIVNAKK